EVERLAHLGVDDPALPARANQEAANLVKWVLRSREADALQVAARCRGEPLKRQGQVCSALVGGDGMDLVDDAPARALEESLCATRQHQIERLGRGDEDVGRPAQHRLAVSLWRIARPDTDA